MARNRKSQRNKVHTVFYQDREGTLIALCSGIKEGVSLPEFLQRLKPSETVSANVRSDTFLPNSWIRWDKSNRLADCRSTNGVRGGQWYAPSRFDDPE